MQIVSLNYPINMRIFKSFLSFLLITMLCFSCNTEEQKSIEITIKNTLDFDRSFETIEISTSELKSLQTENFKVIDAETNEELISQTVDYDQDGTHEVLLFQPEISSESQKKIKILAKHSEAKSDSTLMRCYSRFVPERTDDYAWENNRVAFRTYGPTAQKMKEDGVKGGTLSSGMDAWLKRVDYPIINKWYEKHTSGKGSYHEDTGEGLDNFHVGVSRGVGGTAVKVDSNYVVSKNFTSWETVANGPIRTAFTLEYANWNAGENTVSETKFIALDYGQNLTRHIVELKNASTPSVGLTLQNKDGETTTNKEERWMSYWEPYFDSELGQGIVITEKNQLDGFDKYEVEAKDESNLYVNLINTENLIDYYAGFGWKKSGQFNSKEEWNNYLSRFSKCLDSPLEVTFNKTIK